jgi:hypothetical protein
MEIPVPNDWDGESWNCFQIEWPDSPEWHAILAGLVTAVQRGPFWRARNKTEVEAAKALGRAVVVRNLPFRDCVICPDDGNDQGGKLAFGDAGGLGGCCIDCEELCEMGCITNLTIENGQLIAWYGPCCPVVVGDIGDVGLGDDPYNQNPDVPPTTEFSACGKAAAIVAVVREIVDAIWDARDDIEPWHLYTIPAGRFPDISFNPYWLLQANLTALAVDALYEVADVFDQSTLDTIQCQLALLFDDDWKGLQEGDFLKVEATFINNFGLLIGTLYRQAIDAMGDGDLDRYVKTGASDTSATCDCPPGAGGELGDVIWSADSNPTENNGDYTFLGRYDGGLTARHQYVTNDPESAYNSVQLIHGFDVGAGIEIEEMTLKFTPLNPLGELLHNTWHDPEATDCVTLEDAATGSIEAANRTEQTSMIVGSSIFYRERWSVGWTSNAHEYDGRACPRNVVGKVYQWQVSIISINDELTGLGSNPLD